MAQICASGCLRYPNPCLVPCLTQSGRIRESLLMFDMCCIRLTRSRLSIQAPRAGHALLLRMPLMYSLTRRVAEAPTRYSWFHHGRSLDIRPLSQLVIYLSLLHLKSPITVVSVTDRTSQFADSAGRAECRIGRTWSCFAFPDHKEPFIVLSLVGKARFNRGRSVHSSSTSRLSAKADQRADHNSARDVPRASKRCGALS